MGKLTSYILTILFSLASLTSKGQGIGHDCGLDKSPKLNECELKFLDIFFSDEYFKKKDHDFKDRRFAFISAGQLFDKDDFFKLIADYQGPKGFDFFNNEQTAKIGFDGIIIINLKTYNLNNIVKMIEKNKDK